MPIVMLLIARAEGEHLSLHDDDDSAFLALTRYVDENWADAQLGAEAAGLDPRVRIEAWFTATKAFYLIAEASVTGRQS